MLWLSCNCHLQPSFYLFCSSMDSRSFSVSELNQRMIEFDQKINICRTKWWVVCFKADTCIPHSILYLLQTLYLLPIVPFRWTKHQCLYFSCAKYPLLHATNTLCTYQYHDRYDCMEMYTNKQPTNKIRTSFLDSIKKISMMLKLFERNQSEVFCFQSSLRLLHFSHIWVRVTSPFTNTEWMLYSHTACNGPPDVWNQRIWTWVGGSFHQTRRESLDLQARVSNWCLILSLRPVKDHTRLTMKWVPARPSL